MRMRMLQQMWLAAVMAVLFGAGMAIRAFGEEPQSPAPPKSPKARVGGLPAPDYLSETARMALRQKMEHHGQDAIDLMMAVTLLQYDVAKDAAARIEQEPRLTRPVAGGEGDVNAALPERFFVLQDEVRTRTKQIRDAATRRDDQALATAYGRLTATCVECHSAYLHKQ